MQLDKIDLQFRFLADQLFFTDRTDLDLSNFQTLFGNKDEHYQYLMDRFFRSTQIFWEESFWLSRFDLLFTHNPRRMDREIESHLLSQFWRLISNNMGATPQFNNEYLQFVDWVKVISRRKEDVNDIREFLLGLGYTVQAARLSSIIENFIPYIFCDMAEYISILSQRVGQSARSFEILRQLEKQGLPVDKSQLFRLVKDLLFKRVPNRGNRRSFFAMIDDASLMAALKNDYKLEHRARLIALLHKCDFKEIEENHLRNIKNLLEIDSTIADELLTIYSDKLYARGTGNKGANIKRLIRACKTYPQFSPKKVLAYLSANNRMSDVKFLVNAFPDLKVLVPFI